MVRHEPFYTKWRIFIVVNAWGNNNTYPLSESMVNIKYTPDFVSDTFIIECKGRANESFPLRWKMFKKHVKEHIPHVTLYKPQNQKDCDEVVKLILNKIK